MGPCGSDSEAAPALAKGCQRSNDTNAGSSQDPACATSCKAKGGDTRAPTSSPAKGCSGRHSAWPRFDLGSQAGKRRNRPRIHYRPARPYPGHGMEQAGTRSDAGGKPRGASGAGYHRTSSPGRSRSGPIRPPARRDPGQAARLARCRQPRLTHCGSAKCPSSAWWGRGAIPCIKAQIAGLFSKHELLPPALFPALGVSDEQERTRRPGDLEHPVGKTAAQAG